MNCPRRPYLTSPECDGQRYHSAHERNQTVLGKGYSSIEPAPAWECDSPPDLTYPCEATKYNKCHHKPEVLGRKYALLSGMRNQPRR